MKLWEKFQKTSTTKEISSFLRSYHFIFRPFLVFRTSSRHKTWRQWNPSSVSHRVPHPTKLPLAKPRRRKCIKERILTNLTLVECQFGKESVNGRRRSVFLSSSGWHRIIPRDEVPHFWMFRVLLKFYDHTLTVLSLTGISDSLFKYTYSPSKD